MMDHLHLKTVNFFDLGKQYEGRSIREHEWKKAREISSRRHWKHTERGSLLV